MEGKSFHTIFRSRSRETEISMQMERERDGVGIDTAEQRDGGWRQESQGEAESPHSSDASSQY